MKAKVRVKYIDEYTHNTKCRVFPFAFPDFKEKRELWQGKELVTTIEEQMMQYLDEIDKNSFMTKNGMALILDYDIHHKKEKVNERESFVNYLKEIAPKIGLTSQNIIDVMQFSKESKTLFGKRKSNYNKLCEILDGIRLANLSTSVVLSEIMDNFGINQLPPAESNNDYDYEKTCQFIKLYL